MKTSEQINEIAAALAKAQGNFPKIEKRKQASVKGVAKASGREYSISYAYADIADIISVISPVLSKEGISFIQPTIMIEGGMFIVTRLMHASGQWIESEYPVCSIGSDHQKMGGALTYARRYALCSMVGVAADEDIDGEGSEHPVKPTQKKEPPKPLVTDSFQPIRDEPPMPDEAFPGDEPLNPEALAYVIDCKGLIQDWTSPVANLKQWWADEAKHREAVGIVNGSELYNDLFQTFKDKGLSLSTQPKRAA